jgi:chromosome condensin MukBEF complex kleisin-like MukF subunit
MIPRDIKQQIDNYIDEGIPPSAFLYYLLTNQLREAVGHADDFNKRALYDIAIYLENYMPNMAWGSTERVEKWLGFHRENPAFIKAAIDYDKLKRATYYERLRGSDTVDG